MNVSELEVIWPLHNRHYLSVPDPIIVNTAMAAADETPAPPIVVTPGRDLAARALLAGANCSQQRVSALLGVSRRTIGRTTDTDLMAALRDAQVLAIAQTCLVESASRGSTVEERAAATAWLDEAARDEHQVERSQHQAVVRRPAKATRHRPGRAQARGPQSHGADGPVTRPAAPSHGRAKRRPRHPRPALALEQRPECERDPVAASLTRDQLDACGRLHRRIRVRTNVIRRLLEPETARDDVMDTRDTPAGRLHSLIGPTADLTKGRTPARPFFCGDSGRCDLDEADLVVARTHRTANREPAISDRNGGGALDPPCRR